MTPSQIVHEINRRIGDTEQLTFLYFYSDGCRACNPGEVGLMQELTKHEAVAVNVDAVPDVWSALALSSVPTWLLVGNGQAFAEWPGVLGTQVVANKAVKVLREVRPVR